MAEEKKEKGSKQEGFVDASNIIDAALGPLFDGIEGVEDIDDDDIDLAAIKAELDKMADEQERQDDLERGKASGGGSAVLPGGLTDEEQSDYASLDNPDEANVLDYLPDFGVSEAQAAADAAYEAGLSANDPSNLVGAPPASGAVSGNVVEAVAKASASDAAGQGASGQGGKSRPVYHLRVTTDSLDRGQLGDAETAHAPFADWKIELVDKDGNPQPLLGDGRKYLTFYGSPLIGYLRVTKQLVPYLARKVAGQGGVFDNMIEGVVSRHKGLAGALDKKERQMEQDAQSLLKSIEKQASAEGFKGNAGELLKRYISKDAKGNFILRNKKGTIAPFLGIIAGEVAKRGYDIDRAGNLVPSGWDWSSGKRPNATEMNKAWLNVTGSLSRGLGISEKDAGRLLKDAVYLARTRVSDRQGLEDLNRRNQFRSKQLSDFFNFGGNANPLYGYLFNLKDKPVRMLYRNGELVTKYDFDPRTKDAGLVKAFGSVFPGIPLPYLNASSKEAKELVAQATDSKGRIDFDKLQGELSKRNREFYGGKSSLTTSEENEPSGPGPVMEVTTPSGETVLLPSVDLIMKHPDVLEGLKPLWRDYFTGVTGNHKYSAHQSGDYSSEQMGRDDSKMQLYRRNRVLGDLRERLFDMAQAGNEDAAKLGNLLDEWYRTTPEDEKFVLDEGKREFNLGSLTEREAKGAGKGGSRFSKLLRTYGNELTDEVGAFLNYFNKRNPEIRERLSPLAVFDENGNYTYRSPEIAKKFESNDSLRKALIRSLIELEAERPGTLKRGKGGSKIHFSKNIPQIRKAINKIDKELELKRQPYSKNESEPFRKKREEEVAALEEEKARKEAELQEMLGLRREVEDRLISVLAGRKNTYWDPEKRSYVYGEPPAAAGPESGDGTFSLGVRAAPYEPLPEHAKPERVMSNDDYVNLPKDEVAKQYDADTELTALRDAEEEAQKRRDAGPLLDTSGPSKEDIARMQLNADKKAREYLDYEDQRLKDLVMNFPFVKLSIEKGGKSREAIEEYLDSQIQEGGGLQKALAQDLYSDRKPVLRGFGRLETLYNTMALVNFKNVDASQGKKAGKKQEMQGYNALLAMKAPDLWELLDQRGKDDYRRETARKLGLAEPDSVEGYFGKNASGRDIAIVNHLLDGLANKDLISHDLPLSQVFPELSEEGSKKHVPLSRMIEEASRKVQAAESKMYEAGKALSGAWIVDENGNVDMGSVDTGSAEYKSFEKASEEYKDALKGFKPIYEMFSNIWTVDDEGNVDTGSGASAASAEPSAEAPKDNGAPPEAPSGSPYGRSSELFSKLLADLEGAGEGASAGDYEGRLNEVIGSLRDALAGQGYTILEPQKGSVVPEGDAAYDIIDIVEDDDVGDPSRLLAGHLLHRGLLRNGSVVLPAKLGVRRVTGEPAGINSYKGVFDDAVGDSPEAVKAARKKITDSDKAARDAVALLDELGFFSGSLNSFKSLKNLLDVIGGYRKGFEGIGSDRRIKRKKKRGAVSDKRAKRKPQQVSVGWVASALEDGPFKYLG